MLRTDQLNRRLVERPLSSGLCLGGLGCGGIELWADGVFRHFAIANSRPWAGVQMYDQPAYGTPAVVEPATGPEDLAFLLWVKRPGREPVMRFLFVGHGERFLSWQHMSRTYKFANIPSMPAAECHAEFPFTRLRFLDSRLPVEVELTAWSPFVAHDHDSSSLPGALFDFAITNRSGDPIEVSIIQIASNLAGWNVAKPGQRHALRQLPAGPVIAMTGGSDPAATTTGSMAAFATQRPGQRISAVDANPWIENLYLSIHHTGHVDGPLQPEFLVRSETRDGIHNDSMQRNKAWLAVGQPVPVDGTARIRTGIAWHFPNHYSYDDQRRLGKYYENRFADAAAVAEHLQRDGDDLYARSRAWTDAILRSDLEPALALAMLDQANTLVKSTWLTRAGNLLVWEGLGCAGLNTVDVDHYGSYGTALLFPALRRGGADLTGAGQRPNGAIPHAFMRDEDPRRIPDNEYRRFDVDCQWILAAYREWRWSGDEAFLRRSWPVAAKALAYLRTLPRHGGVLPITSGGITYDHWHLDGVVTYFTGLWLTALQAAAAMAAHLGEAQAARELLAEWTAGRAKAEELLWLGGHYRTVLRSGGAPAAAKPAAEGDMYQAAFHTGDAHAAELAAKPVDTGLHTDAMNGDATALLLGLPRSFDGQRVRATLQLIDARNRHEDGRFIANGSCTDGSFPDQWPFCQWQNPWTGTEYFLAAQCFAEGLEEQGLRIIRDVHARMDEAGVRFNHNECGDYYSRALSIYAAHLAWLGLRHDAVAGELSLRPMTRERAASSPYFTATSWGRVAFRRDGDGFRAELTPLSGGMRLAALALPGDGAVRASLDGRALELDGRRLRQPVELRAGQTLVVATGA